jgi:Domain of unknown function (DUF6438)
VAVSTDGISFEGRGYVVASGKRTAKITANEVRKLAKRFVTADFYSMDSKYIASVTDSPAYLLSISIDGHEKKVEDYVGSSEGMPAVITELEDELDASANTQRWIEGGDGLVEALQAEKFNFQSFEAQVMLKQAASRGQSGTVREFVAAGVPLDPVPASKAGNRDGAGPLGTVGLLTAASRNIRRCCRFSSMLG